MTRWQLRERLVVETAGMVAIIQAPATAKEIRFITLEDEFELINVVVFPDMYQRTRKIIRGSASCGSKAWSSATKP